MSGSGWTVDEHGRIVFNARQAVAGAPWCDDLIIARKDRAQAYIGPEAHAALVELIQAEPARPSLTALEEEIARSAGVRITHDMDDSDRALMTGLLMIIDRLAPMGATPGEPS